MISFDNGEWRFHLRAAAVVRDGELVLLHRAADDPFWALPGGRVDVGETAEAAVRREMLEELGTVVKVERLLTVAENIFSYRGRPHHALEMHFNVSLPAGCSLLGSAPFERVEDGGVGLNGDAVQSTRLCFRWFHVNELQSLDLRPSFLHDSLKAAASAGPQHIAHDSRK